MHYIIFLYFENVSEKAIRETGDQNIETAMDWLISNSEKEQQPADDNIQSNVEQPASTATTENPSTEPSAVAAKSIKCDE